LFAEQGGMILFSSHRLDIVEQICSRVVILKAGRIVAEGPVDRLRQSYATTTLDEVFAQVTDQDDYSGVARRILDVVHE